jgi:DNA polymerase-1
MNTGRLSSGDMRENKPNLQNLPSDELTRSCFIAEPGHKYIAVDYSSQEQIVLANFSGEENLINFYKKGFTDMHSYVAFLMYERIRRCTIEELEPHSLDYIKKEHPDLRYLAKTAGFAINYGGNGATIAKNTGISKKEGDFVYNSYFEAFPGLRNYFDYVMDLATHNHYILFNSLTGRKLFISPDEPMFKYEEEMAEPYFWSRPDARSIQGEYNKSKSEIQRKAQNYPIQGTSADCSKLAGVILFNQLIQKDLLFKVKIVNMVHDEFNVEAPEEIAEEVSELVVKCMVAAGAQFCKTVPLNAEAQIGDHWLH